MLFIAIISKTYFFGAKLLHSYNFFFLQILIMSHDLIETNLKNLFFLQIFLLYFCITFHIVISNCFLFDIIGYWIQLSLLIKINTSMTYELNIELIM
jgi:hypothetical protein